MLIASYAVTVMAEPPGIELSGQWTQGGVIVGQAPPGAKLWLDGKPLRPTPEGRFVFGFGRDAGPQSELRVQLPGRPAQRYVHAVTARKFEIQRIEGLPSEMVTPPPEVLERIAREQKLFDAARALDSDRDDFVYPFIWPALGRISGIYGSQRILNGVAKQPHYGVDIAVPAGTPVHAPAAGVVSLAEPDLYYSGGTLMIDHGHGLESALVHLSKLLVRKGQHVKQGQIVAKSGMTGRATGPHVHWGVSWFDVRVDAQLLAGPMPAHEQMSGGAGK